MPTPIKVKGRGPRKRAWTAPDPNRFKQVKRQRLVNEDTVLEEPNSQTQPGSLSASIRRKRVKTKRPAALIEQLPTEILEHIFLLSKNLNFPRSSLRIGYILSHPSLLLELTVAAFTPSWESLLLTDGQKPPSASFDHGYPDRVGGNPDFQSDVLASPWMKVSLLNDAQNVWQRRVWKSRPTVHQPGPPPIIETGFADLEADLEIFKNYLVAKKPGPRAVGCARFVGDRGVHCHLEKHPLTRVPNHLLTGPFDWDKVKLLFWLVRSAAAVMPSTSPHYQSWELTFRGYKHIVALKDQDPAMSAVLFELFNMLQVFKDWPLHLFDEDQNGA